mmetsp:Transcript_35488/g.81218  ORF Transcript_35488/g.81218 Transcript_35488/m.81218 type:complete len:843 (+) Transcript_35488:134-2662(+)
MGGFRVGDHAAQFELIRILGRGTFAEVFLGNDLRCPHGRHVAVKTVACDVGGDSGDRAREAALAEAKLLQGFQHPHIVVCEEVCWEPALSVVWLALELMDGGDVQTLIEIRREEASCVGFEDHLLRRLLAAVGSALCYIHSRGVLHRDVKPANMLIARRSQRIKLGDFGISKILQTTARARTVVGTPYYLAPEMVSGQDYGVAADAWALGVSLYEAATLQRPFEAANPLALAQKICHEEPGLLPVCTAPDVLAAVSGLLRKDVRKRVALREALGVSDAVLALATELPEEAHYRSRRPSVSPSDRESLSPVSLTLSDTGCFEAVDHADAEDLLASLSLAVSSPSAQERHTYPQTGSSASSSSSSSSSFSPRSLPRRQGRCLLPAIETARAGSRRKLSPVKEAKQHTWKHIAAIAMARAALNSEDDDINELRSALETLEREGCRVQACSGAWEALQSELQLRLSALTTDATMLGHDETRAPTALGRLSVPEVNGTPRVLSATQLCDAFELTASCRGTMKLRSPEEEAPKDSWTSMLTLQITLGVSMRICMLPPGATYLRLLRAVALRFGLPENALVCAVQDSEWEVGEDAMVGMHSCPTAPVHPPSAPLRRANSTSSADWKVQFLWRDGGDVVRINNQATWEHFLRLLARRLGAMHSAGRAPAAAATARLELQTQIPIMVEGRCALPRDNPVDKRGPARTSGTPLKMPPLPLVGVEHQCYQQRGGGFRGPSASPPGVSSCGLGKAARAQCKSARRYSARGCQVAGRHCAGQCRGRCCIVATHRERGAAPTAPPLPVASSPEPPPLHLLQLRGQSAFRGRDRVAACIEPRDHQGLSARAQAVGGG